MTAAAVYRPSSALAERAQCRQLKAANSKSIDSADTSLRRAVLARLIADPGVSTGHIGVTAVAGRVTLSGYVTSHAQKEAASATTRNVKGVEQVVDEVWVAVPCPAMAEHLEAPPSIAALRPMGVLTTVYATETGVRRPEVRP